MNVQLQSTDPTIKERRLPFETVALVLQGGGALGAYQAGIYEALAEAGIEPDWIAGVSIGAINAAIIAGNRRDARVEKLRQFWTRVTSDRLWPWYSHAPWGFAKGEIARNFLNQFNAKCRTRKRSKRLLHYAGSAAMATAGRDYRSHYAFTTLAF